MLKSDILFHIYSIWPFMIYFMLHSFLAAWDFYHFTLVNLSRFYSSEERKSSRSEGVHKEFHQHKRRGEWGCILMHQMVDSNGYSIEFLSLNYSHIEPNLCIVCFCVIYRFSYCLDLSGKFSSTLPPAKFLACAHEEDAEQPVFISSLYVTLATWPLQTDVYPSPYKLSHSVACILSQRGPMSPFVSHTFYNSHSGKLSLLSIFFSCCSICTLLNLFFVCSFVAETTSFSYPLPFLFLKLSTECFSFIRLSLLSTSNFSFSSRFQAAFPRFTLDTLLHF